MKRLLIVAVACAAGVGCKKMMEPKPSDSGDSGSGGSGGAVQGVRGAVNRTVTQAELHDLHLFMTQAKLSTGNTPTAQQTWAALQQPNGNQKLFELVRDGLIVLVPTPGEEGLWAYEKDAPTRGGMVLTHSGATRMTRDQFLALQQQPQQ